MGAVRRTAPRAGEMYGCLPGDLIGQPVESLVAGGLRTAYVSQRPGYAGYPTPGVVSVAPITERD